jgi:acetolactate synthase I/II/III large subunit
MICGTTKKMRVLEMANRTGGRVLIDALEINGVEKIFGVPGESYLEALDALHDHKPQMEYITCRQEGGASFMACAYGRLTGKVGICFVTRGPGATNASIGVHTAFQDAAPMILLVGQVPRGNIDREAFQEIDYRLMYAQMAKWVAQIEDPARIPEFINRAFQAAQSGRPGPVVLALPEDMLREETDAADLAPARPVQANPGLADLEQMQAMLAQAKKPLVIVGGSVWRDEARLAFEEFCQRNNIPVAAAFRRQGLFDAHHDCYVGDVAWGNIDSVTKAIDECDLLISLGARLDEGTTCKYSVLEPPVLKQKFIHIYPQAEELGRVFKADLMINSGVCEMAFALQKLDLNTGARFADWRERLRAGYIESLSATPQPGDLDMGMVMAHLREVLPRDTIVATGAGNFADWPNKIYQYTGCSTNLSSISGAMGYGVPAATMASIVNPGRPVVCFTGDGDFLMNGQELATAMQYGGKPIILVINNGLYGTIRMHQQRRHPGRVSGTELMNPDFAMYAQAFGAYGETVTRTEDFAAAFARARKSGGAALLDLKIDPESICYNAPALSDIEPL